jgi:hypothetical protein
MLRHRPKLMEEARQRIFPQRFLTRRVPRIELWMAFEGRLHSESDTASSRYKCGSAELNCLIVDLSTVTMDLKQEELGFLDFVVN